MGSSRTRRWMMDAGRMALGEVFECQALLSEVPGSRSVGYILDQSWPGHHPLLPHRSRRVSSLLTTPGTLSGPGASSKRVPCDGEVFFDESCRGSKQGRLIS